MKKYTYIASLLILTSCGVTKQSSKNIKDIQSTEAITTQIKRKGDTLSIEIPKITYKDTTIVKTNYINRTEARITYDSKGNASVDCISGEIDELKKEFRTFIDNSKKKESEKTEAFNPQYLIWSIAGLGLIILLGGGLFLYIFTKAQTATQNTLIEIAKGVIK